MLPLVLAKRNSRGVPWVSVVLCGLAWGLALKLPFERLISIDLILYGSSLLLEFVALAVLRVREPNLERPFKAGNFACVLLGVVRRRLSAMRSMHRAMRDHRHHIGARVAAESGCWAGALLGYSRPAGQAQAAIESWPAPVTIVFNPLLPSETCWSGDDSRGGHILPRSSFSAVSAPLRRSNSPNTGARFPCSW